MSFLAGRQDARSVDERLGRYVARELPQRLGLEPPPSAGVRIGSFARGRSACVRHATLPGYGPVVVRAYVTSSKRRRLKGYRELHERLTACGVPAPRLLFVDDTSATRRAYGFGVLAEEFIDGRIFAELPPGTQDRLLEPVADVLAALHGVRSPEAGRPWEGQRWRPRVHARRRVALWLGRIRLVVAGLRHRRRRRLAAWFADRVHALGREAYPLIHEDVDKTNVLLDAAGQVRLVDFARCTHWFPQYDLIVSEYSICRDDPARIRVLRDRYFAVTAEDPALCRAVYEATRPLWDAWYHLRAAASRARRSARAEGPKAEHWAHAARDHWSRALDALRQAGAT
ncbi:MAG: aminoglycoside phosphotransferase family protein [Candidatus Brocadiia bacterium]